MTQLLIDLIGKAVKMLVTAVLLKQNNYVYLYYKKLSILTVITIRRNRFDNCRCQNISDNDKLIIFIFLCQLSKEDKIDMFCPIDS